MANSLIDLSRGVPREWIKSIRASRRYGAAPIAAAAVGVQGAIIELDVGQILAAGYQPADVGRALKVQLSVISGGARTETGNSESNPPVALDSQYRNWLVGGLSHGTIAASTTYFFFLRAWVREAVPAFGSVTESMPATLISEAWDSYTVITSA